MEASVTITLVLIILGVLTFIFSGTALGGTAWIVTEVLTTKRESGLWKSCTTIGDEERECSPFTDVNIPSWLKLCRDLLLIACVIIPMCVFTAILKLMLKKGKVFAIVIMTGFFLADVFIMVSLAVYHGEYEKEENDSFGWSLAMAWIAFVFATINLILAIVLSVVDKNENKIAQGNAASAA